MKKRLLLFIIIIITFLFLACSQEEEIKNNNLIQNPISALEISQMDIEIASHKKSFIDDANINLLLDYIRGIEKIDGDVMDIDDQVEPIRIKAYDSQGLIEEITIGKGLAYYNESWYFIESKIYDEIAEFYQALDFEEVENQLVLDINNRLMDRMELALEESLQGDWLSKDGSVLKFKNNKLIQGDQTEYSFIYEIKSMSQNNISITIYGEEGFFLGGRELSTMEISLDPTRSLMKMTRTMISGISHDDELIYLDKDGQKLGFFDSYFFFDDLAP